MKAKFIVVEGLDGAGKSTAISFIKKFLEQKNINAIYTREPGGTKVAEDIRNLALQNNYDETVHSDTELLLMYASRVQHIHSLIKPNLDSGVIVVSDRFYWSSMAYQGGGRGLGFTKLNALNNNFIKDCEPDLIIYLDVEPIIGLQRAKKVGDPDRIEQAGLEFFHRARKTFKDLVAKTGNAYEIDSSLPLLEIEKQICDLLAEVTH
ncbi:dTMP kinase [Francisella adeliensis]|uniref:Thymidylate kinase n=1 Tax=Francisella adeliensis TaxID=2007306 RepID=A0A2Z4Y0N6_9GAMM|nr:dTMP kinase [Francisella adeliensis]AXA34438.1 dTMP kinase [Francisella adeliensis]MBK2086532.1 dTMP kinase [Francisella adeliensis]MBK2096160.1 dTMP kinase [Francisella adeliensis]QIW12685.1 dTMP kinase [Francisella adeliensis]QIW14561.1 dTMP kinase [Francisella adeliensis]